MGTGCGQTPDGGNANKFAALKDFQARSQAQSKLRDKQQERERSFTPELQSILKGAKHAAWYPSSFDDLRPILVSRVAVMQHSGVNVPTGYQEPDLWILSDDAGCYHPLDNKNNPRSWHHWKPGFLFLHDATTNIIFTECLPLRSLDLRGGIGRNYLLTLHIACHIAGEYSMRVLFLNADDRSVYDDVIVPYRVILSHVAFSHGMCSEFVGHLNADPELLNQLHAVKWAFCGPELHVGFHDCGGQLEIGEPSWPVSLWQKL
jgi:hypothetical protein